MKHYYLIGAMLLLFLWEGSVINWLVPSVWQSQVMVSTHFTLVVILFISLYLSSVQGLAYGLVFGLLHDIVYYGPTMIGTFSFGMGVTAYLIGLLAPRSRGNILSSMMAISGGLFLFELILFGLYRVFQVTRVTPQWAFFHVMLPSVLINLLFALLVYVPLRKWLEAIGAGMSKEE